MRFWGQRLFFSIKTNRGVGEAFFFSKKNACLPSLYLFISLYISYIAGTKKEKIGDKKGKNRGQKRKKAGTKKEKAGTKKEKAGTKKEKKRPKDNNNNTFNIFATLITL